MTGNTPMVEVKGVCKSFGRTEVLRSIDLTVDRGEVVCVLGPSGSGKSTLLYCINHLERIDAGELYVTQGLQRIDRRLVLGEVKTEASEAPLPLPDICVTALRQRQKVQAEHEETAGKVWQNGHQLVFTTRYGTPIEPRNFIRSFKARCAKAGVPSIRVHDTRHTCGSLLAALGVHPRVAMQILRHSKITVTMEIYTHVPSEDTQKALKQLGESLGGSVGENGE